MMSAFITGWYLIYTYPRHEKKLAEYLREKSVETFLPTIRVVRQWNDRKKVVESPLFPSYLFVRLNDIQSYYCVLESGSSLYYVKTGKENARVSDAMIENIRLISGYGEQVEVSSDHFQAGRKIVIQQGPLTGLSGEVVQYKGRNKILVRVNLLKRNVLLALQAEDIHVFVS